MKITLEYYEYMQVVMIQHVKPFKKHNTERCYQLFFCSSHLFLNVQRRTKMKQRNNRQQHNQNEEKKDSIRFHKALALLIVLVLVLSF